MNLYIRQAIRLKEQNKGAPYFFYRHYLPSLSFFAGLLPTELIETRLGNTSPQGFLILTKVGKRKFNVDKVVLDNNLSVK